MGGNSIIVDLNRKRAGVSYLNLKNYLGEDREKDEKKMKSYCRKLPILIKTNGLVDTLCFIKGKGKNKEKKNEYSYIFDWITDWFKEIGYCSDKKDIIEQLVELNNNQYYIYTMEAMEISSWYKKNAESMIEDSDVDEKNIG